MTNNPSIRADRPLTKAAHQRIVALIVTGKLEPGQRISEQALSEHLQIGRTPVREAIRLLVAQDIMEQVPRYGTFVKKQELRDVVELFEVREAVESFAIYKATPNLRAQDLERLQGQFQIMEEAVAEVGDQPEKAKDMALTSRIVEADQRFHLTLIHAAGNRRILRILSETQVLARSFAGKVVQQDQEVIKSAHREHKAIWHAVKKGDAESARDLMIRHIRKSRQEAVEYFEKLDRRINDSLLESNLGESIE